MSTPTAPTAPTIQDLPTGTVAAFLTLCGATVALIKHNGPAAPRFDHKWKCLGCGATDGPDTEPQSRRGANGHASECRSIPLPTT